MSAENEYNNDTAVSAGKDRARVVGAAAMLLLCAVIVAVIVIMALGSRPQRDDSALPECNANNCSQFAYDGDILYFAGDMDCNGHVSIYSVRDGEKTQLLGDDAVRRFRLCGDQIVYLAYRDGNYELCLLPKTGGDNRILQVLPGKENATVTEFDYKNGTLYTLYDGILDACNSADGTLSTVAEGVLSFALSGDDLYYSTAEGIYRLKKGAAAPLSVGSAASASGLAMSGSRLYYRTGEGVFYIDEKKETGEMIVVLDADVTSFCVADGTVYYIRAVSAAERGELAAAMAEEQGMSEAQAQELLIGVGHLFRVSGSGGTPTSVGGKYVAAFAMAPGKIYYKAFLYSHVFYEYVED